MKYGGTLSNIHSNKPVLSCRGLRTPTFTGICNPVNAHRGTLSTGPVKVTSISLLSHHRSSKLPGDSVEMVQARRRIFDSGLFNPLAELVHKCVATHLATCNTPDQAILVDAGCGEGMFLGTTHDIPLAGRYGLDISKEAVRSAARRHKECRWVIANLSHRLPFTDHSTDIVFSILAPRNAEEFARILKPSGTLIVVVPGTEHLLELRTRLMADAGNFNAKAEKAIEQCSSFFAVQSQEQLRHTQTLTNEQLVDLIQMTPMYWRATHQAKTGLTSLNELKVTMDFTLIHFGLNPLRAE